MFHRALPSRTAPQSNPCIDASQTNTPTINQIGAALDRNGVRMPKEPVGSPPSADDQENPVLSSAKYCLFFLWVRQAEIGQ